MTGPDAVATTSDTVLGSRLRLRQPARGHRAGTDAMLLAAAVPHRFDGLVYDVGAGVGTVGLCIALTCPAARVALVENEPFTAALAEDNIAQNGLAARVRVEARDLFEPAEAAPADMVVSNPPYYDAGRVHVSPDPRRKAAYVGPTGGLSRWIAACLALLGPKGTLIVVHRTDALPDLLIALAGRAGAVTIMPVHTRYGAPASRILVRAVKGSRAPLTIMPGLNLRDGEGLTPLAVRLNRGEVALDW